MEGKKKDPSIPTLRKSPGSGGKEKNTSGEDIRPREEGMKRCRGEKLFCPGGGQKMLNAQKKKPKKNHHLNLKRNHGRQEGDFLTTRSVKKKK